MSFTKWLSKQRDRNDWVGDLAIDAHYDKKWPKRGKSFDIFERHLEEMGARDNAIEALKTAWKEYTTE